MIWASHFLSAHNIRLGQVDQFLTGRNFLLQQKGPLHLLENARKKKKLWSENDCLTHYNNFPLRKCVQNYFAGINSSTFFVLGFYLFSSQYAQLQQFVSPSPCKAAVLLNYPASSSPADVYSRTDKISFVTESLMTPGIVRKKWRSPFLFYT